MEVGGDGSIVARLVHLLIRAVSGSVLLSEYLDNIEHSIQRIFF